jgi:hypothetical protein
MSNEPRASDKQRFMCERCWRDAYVYMLVCGGHQSDHYRDLLSAPSRRPCTPQEQAGQFWDEEKQMDIRTEVS